MQDLYKTLGVSRSASADEIKRAYRKLARSYHPDTNPGDTAAEERFKEVQAAYDVLGDREKRARYDQLGSGMFDPSGAGGFGGFQFGGNLGDLSDLLGGLIGARGRRGGPRERSRGQPGQDVEVAVSVSFEDSLRGLETRIPVTLDLACSSCGGTGAEPGTAPVVCPECRGRGVRAENQGVFALSQPCPRCRGNGTVVERPCQLCGGGGREQRTKRYRVKIPAGVKDGTRIRLKGKGGAGFGGGLPGDLTVVTHVAASPIFERRGADLLIEIPVTLAEAALGATVAVPTPDGTRVLLKVPAGSQDGKLLRLRGHGAPKLDGGRGDLLARLRLAVPTRLSKQEREALENLQKVTRDNPRDRLSAWA